MGRGTVYNKWDGSVGDNSSKSTYQLTLVLRVNDFDENVMFRAKIRNPENIGLENFGTFNFKNNYSISYYDEYWSEQLLDGEYAYNAIELLTTKIELTSEENGVIVQSADYNTPIIFDNGEHYGAMGYWVETNNPKSDEFLILSRDELLGDAFQLLSYDGVPKDWNLFIINYNNYLHGSDDPLGIKDKVTFKEINKKVTIDGFHFNGKYFRFLPPRIKVAPDVSEIFCNDIKIFIDEKTGNYDISNHITDDVYVINIKALCGNEFEEHKIEFVKSLLNEITNDHSLDASGQASKVSNGIFGANLTDKDYQPPGYPKPKNKILYNKAFTVESKVHIPKIPNTIPTLNTDILQIVRQRKGNRITDRELRSSIKELIYYKCGVVEPDPTNFIISVLVDLGNLEYSNNYYYLTSTSFIQKISKSNEAFLTGWRDESLLHNIIDQSQRCKDVSIVFDNNYTLNNDYVLKNNWMNLLPTPINLIAKDEDILYRFLKEFQYSNNSNSWSILNWSHDKKTVLNNIQDGWTIRNLGNTAKYQSFNFKTLGWENGRSKEDCLYGLYREKRFDGEHYFLVKDEYINRINLDWGMNIYLSELKYFSLFYDEFKKVLLCPYKCKLPLLVSRGLALCSGLVQELHGNYLETGNSYLGRFRSIREIGWHNKWFIAYRSVPWPIAQKVAEMSGRQMDKI